MDDKGVCDFVGRTFAEWRIEFNRVFLAGHDSPVKAAEGLWKYLHKNIKASDQLGTREGLVIDVPSGSLFILRKKIKLSSFTFYHQSSA